MREFFKYLLLLIMQIVIAVISVPFVMSIVNYRPLNSTITGSDSIAIANTFMVFVTFIVVVGTVAITIAGIVYSNWFSKQKVAVIRENMQEVVEALLKEKNLKDEVLLEILKQPKINQLINTHIEELTSGMRNDFKSERKNIHTAIDEKFEKFETNILSIIDKRMENIDAAETLNKIFGDKK